MLVSAVYAILLCIVFCQVESFRVFPNVKLYHTSRVGRAQPLNMQVETVLIKDKLSTDMKEAMKAKEKVRLGAIRSVQVAIKQKEVDDRVELT
jgi:hypothetical protein